MPDNPLLEAALQYAGRGWRVLPLHGVADECCTCRRGRDCLSAGKHPRIKTGRGHAAASTSAEQIVAWWTKWPNANVGAITGAASGIAVVDIDTAEGVNLLRQIAAGKVLEPTAAVVSGRSGGGLHLLFAVNSPTPTNSGNGLDIRGDGGLVVLPPSMHKSGNRYRWANQNTLARAPEWLIAWFAERGGKRTTNPGSFPGSSPMRAGERASSRNLAQRSLDNQRNVTWDDVAAALDVIPNEDIGWDAWNRIGMACWRALEGLPEGADLFDAWSRKSRKWREGAAHARWTHYASSPPADIDFGTLVYEARRVQPGWLPPSKAPREIREEVMPIDCGRSDVSATPTKTVVAQPALDEPGRAINGHALAFPGFQAAATPANPLIELNEKYAVIGDIGGKCLVMSWVASKIDETVKVPSFQTFNSFRDRYSNRYVDKGINPKTGAAERAALGGEWLKWPHRRSFEGIDLIPDQPPSLPGGILNLWTGLAVQPMAGEWNLMREHICKVLGAGERSYAEYILRWAAWAVQNPGKRAEVALVFRGGKGSGKGTFANALRRIFGTHGLQLYSPKHLIGSFNGHLRSCLLLFADEAFWAGDKQGESVLKGMLTEPTIVIEQKGIDAIPWINRLHVIMAANSEWVVPASADERRFAVFDVSGDKIGCRDYFEAINAEMENGGLAAMLYDLLRCDLRGWHPRMVPQTAGLQAQKARSLPPIAEWWEHVLQQGSLPLKKAQDKSERVAAYVLLNMLREFAPKSHEINPTRLGRFLAQFGGIVIHTKDCSMWRFPELAEARKIWEKNYGKWPWRHVLPVWNAEEGANPSTHHQTINT